MQASILLILAESNGGMASIHMITAAETDRQQGYLLRHPRFRQASIALVHGCKEVAACAVFLNHIDCLAVLKAAKKADSPTAPAVMPYHSFGRQKMRREA